MVWSIARRYARCASDAEDATQEIFLSLWQSAGRFDPSLGSELTFVATIAHRRMVDWMRRQSTRRAAVHVSFDDVDVDRLVGALPADHDPSDADGALRVFLTLRPEYRRVLELAFCHGLTQTEIAARLSMPLGTVKSYMRRGLLEVRGALQENQREATLLAAGAPAASRPATNPLGFFVGELAGSLA